MNLEQIDRNKLLKKLHLSNNIPKAVSKTLKKEKDIEELRVKDDLLDLDLDITESNSIDSTLELNDLARLPALHSNNVDRNTETQSNYVYYLTEVLDTENKFLETDKLVHICVYNIVESTQVDPFILYLLNKDHSSNKMFFPHFTSKKNIFDEAKEKLGIILENYDDRPVLKVYIETDTGVYIIYEFIQPYKLQELSYDDLWWWCGINEIMNAKVVLNFDIHSSVYDVFFKYPLLSSLFDQSKQKLETPYILYSGAYSSYISFIATFGLPKEAPDSNLGPYYYFFTYIAAGRGAKWTNPRKEKFVDGEKITVNDFGVHKLGGIVRFAVFGNKIKYFLNREDDPKDDPDLITNAYDKESKFMKAMLKMRDVNGNWADNYDMAYIGAIPIYYDDKFQKTLSIQFTVRDFYQQIPLTYHYVNTKELSENKDEEFQNSQFRQSYDIPYNIE